MLRRSAKIQLVLFVVITLLGVSYVGAEYVGLAKYVTGDSGCKVSADFPENGGIFTNAEVTYRGVTVGKVGALHLIHNGVRVDLELNNCSSPKIPANSSATIADRSVVGEQYVNLDLPTPTTKPSANHLQAGDVIPMNNPNGTPRNHIPVATQTLLVDIDQLVNSVDLNSLRTTVSELGQAFANRGNDLSQLLDSTNQLLKAASDPANLNATIALIDQSSTVLQTQLDEQQPLQVWTHSLNLLSQQLKKSDPDIRHLFDTGSSDLNTITNFVNDNKTDFGVTLANLSTIGNLLVEHLPGLEEVFELYPALAAGGPTALRQNKGWLGLILTTTPADCGSPSEDREGYDGTVRRQANATAPIAPNVAARCTAPPPKNVRGSAHVPGGDPVSISGGGYAYPRVVTKNTLRVGPPLATSSSLGDASWLGLVTDSLH